MQHIYLKLKKDCARGKSDAIFKFPNKRKYREEVLDLVNTGYADFYNHIQEEIITDPKKVEYQFDEYRFIDGRYVHLDDFFKIYKNTMVKEAEKSGEEIEIHEDLWSELNLIDSKQLKKSLDKYLKNISEIKHSLIQETFLSKIATIVFIRKDKLKERIEELLNSKEKQPQSAFDLFHENLPDVSYFINPLIPQGTLICYGAKPGKFKSNWGLIQALHIVDGSKVLNQFQTEKQATVLLYDLENGSPILLDRLKFLVNGLGIKVPSLKNLHIEYEFNKNDFTKEIELCEKYDVIIFDSYRRFLKGTENDSEITDKFFKEFLDVLRKKGKTLLVLHHFNKTKVEEIDDDTIMDAFRGSSDIPAQFDLMFSLIKGHESIDPITNNVGFNISVILVKNRLGLKIQDFSFKVEKDDAKKQTNITFLDFGRVKSPKDNKKEMIILFVKNKGPVMRADIESTFPSIEIRTLARYLNELVNIDKSLVKTKNGEYSISERPVTSVIGVTNNHDKDNYDSHDTHSGNNNLDIFLDKTKEKSKIDNFLVETKEGEDLT